MKAHKKKIFRKVLTRSRAEMKTSTSEDVGGEKFTLWATPRTPIPSFYAFARGERGWGARRRPFIYISFRFQATQKDREKDRE
jgi:hypothetical protein